MIYCFLRYNGLGFIFLLSLCFSSSVQADTSNLTGRIQGAVTNEGGAPLEGIKVDVYQEFGLFGWISIASSSTNSQGKYDIGGLDTGVYRVGFSDPSGLYLAHYYDSKTSIRDADDITLSAGEIVSGIECVMNNLAGKIQGAVTNEEGEPLENIQVKIYRNSGGDWSYYKSTNTDSEGKYDIGNLYGGTYRLGFTDPDGQEDSSYHQGEYATHYYDGKLSFEDADEISLSSGEILSDINCLMYVRRGSIKGSVTDENYDTLEGIEVTVYKYTNLLFGAWTSVSSSITNSEGKYDIEGLDTGTYRISFSDPSSLYITHYYDGKSSIENADDITLSAGEIISGIDCVMNNLAARIQGTVTDIDNNPLQDIEVTAYWSFGHIWAGFGSRTSTDSQGHYDLGGLSSRDYRVKFEDPSGFYITQYYDKTDNIDDADDVAAMENHIVTGINAVMSTDKGHLRVFVDNHDAVQAGAQWRRRGTNTWHNSGFTETNVVEGTYTIEFKIVPGWRPEGTVTVIVRANETATATGFYFQQDTALPGVLMLLLDDEK